MIPFSTVAPAINSVITGLAFGSITPSAGADAPAAIWGGRPHGITSPDANRDLTIEITTVNTVGGRDETRLEYDSGTETLTARQYGEREILVQVKIESQADSDTLWCWSTIEAIRGGLQRPSSNDALTAAGAVFVRADPANVLAIRRNGRSLSAGVFTAVFTAALSDAAGESSDFIETTSLTSDVTDVDESSVAANFSDETLP